VARYECGRVRRCVAVLATAVLVICVPITALIQPVWPPLQNAAILLAAIAAAIHYDHPAARLDQWLKAHDEIA
jgi:NhaP-type Na+/H+ or K+/H+ antiporter